MTIKTGNPLFPIRSAAEVTRFAREGLIAEWDCKTFSPAAVMTDLSGNGHDMTFTTAPTGTSGGISFNGTYWGDATLPVLTRNYSLFLVHKMPTSGFVAFGNRNSTAARGVWMRPFPTAGGGTVQIESAEVANDANGPSASATTWTATIVKIYEDNQARAKGLTQGILGYSHTIRGTFADDRALWRLGSGIQNVTDSLNPMPSGEAAYCGVFNRITSERQDAALLAYLKGILTPRGVTISV